MWEPKVRKNAEHYFSRHQVFSLDRWLHKHLTCAQYEDKLSFFESCQQNNIPTPEVLFHCDSPKDIDAIQIPKCALFIKDRFGRKGNFAQKWEYVNESKVWKRHAREFPESEFKQHLKLTFKDTPFIAQELLQSSEDIKNLSNNALCTLRIVTFKFADSKATHLFSVIRIPNGNSDVDNLSQGGLAAGIKSDGTLTKARSLDPRQAHTATHPETDVQIEGTSLRGWDEAIQIALRAHEQLSEHYTIGWDIAMTPEGPSLIEGNRGWGADVIQLGINTPIGLTEYPSLMCQAIEERLIKHPDQAILPLAKKLREMPNKTHGE
jgi:hypothetical protein